MVSMAFVPLINQAEWGNSFQDEPASRINLPINYWVDFVRKYGSGWKIDWDEHMGTPRAIYGSSIRIMPGGIIDGGFLTERLLSFVDENRDLFGTSSAVLQQVSSERHGRLWYVNFRQMVNSFPVYGSLVQFRLSADGRLVSISSRIFREPGPVSSPAVSASTAEALTKAETFFVEGRDRLMETKLVVYPKLVSGETHYFLSWVVDLITVDPPSHWFYVVDAMTGGVIDRWNQIYYEEAALDSIYGRVRGYILPSTPTDTPELEPFEALLVELLSGGTDITDSAGSFLIESDGVIPDSILVELLGSYANVINDSTTDAALRLEAVPGIPNSVLWDETNAPTSERNGFYHAVVVHDYVTALDPSFTQMDYIMPVRVDINQTCNAFWDGFGMNFFRAGGGCANTANIADVIYHEYGHGVTDYQYRPNQQPSGAMHEGFSDYLGATITDQSLIGRGFFGPGSWLRNTDNNRVWPAPECGGSVHCIGESIAGSLWDMRQNLVASLGQEAGVALADSLFHYSRYGFSRTFPDYFMDLLLMDDDDGDLTNGIPHADEICDAFDNHGLSCVLTPNAPIVYDVGNGSNLEVNWQPVPQLMSPISDYVIYYGEESGVYSDSAFSGGDTTVVVTSLDEGQVYYFALAAEDSTGQRSPISQEGTGTPYSVPLAPTGLISESHSNDISLTWNMNSELDLDDYIVFRSLFVDSGYTELAEVPGDDTTYVDLTPDPNIMYYYGIAAVDLDSAMGDLSEPTRGRLMTFDGGILVVDGTKDGQQGVPYSWPDSTVDDFYTDLLSQYPLAVQFDIPDSLEMSLFPLDQAILALYSTVVWHQDDRQSPSMIPYLDDIESYLSQGGNLFLSGWSLINHLSDTSSSVVLFPAGTVPHDYLKLNSGETLTAAASDFEGANSEVVDYPDLIVDSTKSPLFGGDLFSMDIINEPLVDEPVTEQIYTYRSSTADTAHHGKIVGLRYLSDDYNVVVFDFPLFYMEESAALQAIEQVMADFDEDVGITGEGDGKLPLPRVYALHQNYPNPFNPSTSIVIDIPANDNRGGDTEVKTRVVIYNMRGQLIRILMDGMKEPGRYVLNWDGRDNRGERVGSGLYLYRMEAGDFVSTRKMVIVK
jgi:hypothetical protein